MRVLNCWPHKDESKVVQYFGNMRYTSATTDAFAEVMKVMDCQMLSSLDTLRVLLAGFTEVVKMMNHTEL